MSDNPQSVPERGQGQELLLPGYRLVVLEGRDAVAFAHAQFMNDVKSLTEGSWQWNGWLTPKGRVVAMFALLRLATDRVAVLLLDADPEAFVQALRRFVFRSKLTIRVDAARISGRLAAPAGAVGNVAVEDAQRGIELDFGGDGGPRTLRISADFEAAAEVPGVDLWRAIDLEHGLPRLPSSQEGQWTPQMLSLERLHAFSIKKGCYPGQEIVARTHFLGQAKRGLTLFQADATVPVGADVNDAGRVLGTVVSTAPGLVLAVLPLEREAAALQADGVALRERPLLGGLAR